MCLLSEQGIYTADSDIMCYKVGKVSLNGIISPYESFFFEFDKLYTDQKPETIMERIDGLKMIVAGFFHAFADERAALIKAEELRHSYNKKYKVFQALIPKGTKYYKGLHHDICAKSIKILRDTRYEKD
nr:MAG TPA: hypothetical protein [Bacteriophage sp.]